MQKIMNILNLLKQEKRRKIKNETTKIKRI